MHVILIIMSFIMLVPFAWMILTALKTKGEAISVNPFYILPHDGWHWENFGTVWKSYNFVILYKNTLLLIFFRVVCACLTATMAGYAFGRLKFPGRKFLFTLVLVQMMIPAQIFIIPQYLMVSKMGMLNTTFGLVFPGLVTAFGTYLLKGAAVPAAHDAPDTELDDFSRNLHRRVRVQGSDVADDRLHECVHHDTVSGSCQDAGSVRQRVSDHDGGGDAGRPADDHYLRDLPEAVRRRYCYVRRQAVMIFMP